MSNFNPYANTGTTALPGLYQRVFSNPLELAQRSFQMVKGKYWLLLGVSFVGSLLSAFIITLGPMMAGIYHCYSKRESGEEFEFADLFKGFERFWENLLASLVILGLALVLYIPLVATQIVLLIQYKGQLSFTTNLFFNLISAVLGVVIQLPFVFLFPLLAEYRLQPMDAVKLSAKASFANIGSVVVNLICMGFVSMICSMVCCYVGGVFFLPISMGWKFLLYRDVFPKSNQLPAFGS